MWPCSRLWPTTSFTNGFVSHFPFSLFLVNVMTVWFVLGCRIRPMGMAGNLDQSVPRGASLVFDLGLNGALSFSLSLRLAGFIGH